MIQNRSDESLEALIPALFKRRRHLLEELRRIDENLEFYGLEVSESTVIVDPASSNRRSSTPSREDIVARLRSLRVEMDHLRQGNGRGGDRIQGILKRSLEVIAAHCGGYLRMGEAKDMILAAGVSTAAPKNLGGSLRRVLEKSPEFCKVGPGLWEWLGYKTYHNGFGSNGPFPSDAVERECQSTPDCELGAGLPEDEGALRSTGPGC